MVLEQGPVLPALVPWLCRGLRLRVVRGAAEVVDALLVEAGGEVTRDVGRAPSPPSEGSEDRANRSPPKPGKSAFYEPCPPTQRHTGRAGVQCQAVDRYPSKRWAISGVSTRIGWSLIRAGSKLKGH